MKANQNSRQTKELSKVLIYEPDFRGHRLNYVRLLSEGLLAHGIRPTLLLHRNAKSTPEFAAHLSTLEDKTNIQFQSESKVPPVTIIDHWRNAREVRSIILKTKPDYLYIPNGDGISQLLGLFFLFRKLSCKVEIILVSGKSPNNNEHLFFKIKSRLSALSLRNYPWTAIHLISPPTRNWFKRYAPRLLSRTNVIADPTPKLKPMETSEARRKIGIDPDAKWIGCLGPLNKRKGIDLLLNAFFYRNDPPVNSKLLLAGPIDRELQWIEYEFTEQIESGCLVVINKYLDEEIFRAALFSLDVVCLPYRNTRWGSSGMLLQAIAANRLILSSERGWIPHVLRDLKIGESVDIEDQRKFHEAIKNICSKNLPKNQPEEIKQWLNFNSEENFKKGVLSNLIKSKEREKEV